MTMHTRVSVIKDEQRKPDVYTLYNHTMGEVDLVDPISSHNTIKVKTKRWPLNGLSFIINIVPSNAKTLLSQSSNSVQVSSFGFTYQLGKALFLHNVQRVCKNKSVMQVSVLQKIRSVLGVKEINHINSSVEPSVGRCHVSIRNIVGTPEYKIKRQKMNNKIQSKCE